MIIHDIPSRRSNRAEFFDKRERERTFARVAYKEG